MWLWSPGRKWQPLTGMPAAEAKVCLWSETHFNGRTSRPWFWTGEENDKREIPRKVTVKSGAWETDLRGPRGGRSVKKAAGDGCLEFKVRSGDGSVRVIISAHLKVQPCMWITKQKAWGGSCRANLSDSILFFFYLEKFFFFIIEI